MKNGTLGNALIIDVAQARSDADKFQRPINHR
jgi:hypothetical protein